MGYPHITVSQPAPSKVRCLAVLIAFACLAYGYRIELSGVHSMAGLDCVVVGYNEGDFEAYRVMSERAGPMSPEYQIFRKEHLSVDECPLPWMDAFSTVRNKITGRDDRYHVGEVFNLAALYLTSFLRRHGMTAEPVSLFSAERDELAELLAERPTVVAITTTFYVNVLPVVPIVEMVREHSPESRIVIGGPLIDNLCLDGITDTAQDLLFTMGADLYVQESQGESALVHIVQALRDGRDVTQAANVIHCPDGTWELTRRRPEANSLDEGSIDWAASRPDSWARRPRCGPPGAAPSSAASATTPPVRGR